MEHLRDGLQKVMREALGRAPAAEAPLLAWPAACGASVAARTRALACDGGVLRVEVPDATWRTQLAGFAADYLAALNRMLPARVKRIEFVVAANKEKR